MSKINKERDSLIAYSIELIKNKKYEDAQDTLNNCISLNKRDDYAYYLKGLIYQTNGNYNEAITQYTSAININSSVSNYYNNIGGCYFSLKEIDAAINNFYSALKIDSSNLDAVINYSKLIAEYKNKNDEALFLLNQVIDIESDNSEAYFIKGNILKNQLKFSESIKEYNKAINFNPSDSKFYLNKSFALLTLGEYKSGFELYEYRKKINPKIYQHNDSTLIFKENIESYRYKNINIHLYSEQGFGDCIQFIRFIELLHDYKFILWITVNNQLHELIKTNYPYVNIVKSKNEIPLDIINIPIMSLGLIFDVDIKSIPFSSGYLTVDNNKITKWKKIIKFENNDKLKVGIVWSGGENHTVNYVRNISFKEIAHLSQFDIDFISLQKGNSAESEINKNLWSNNNFYNFSNFIDDFSDTAALISMLDLVISVDTSVAHLAGAMGKKTWILNRYNTCWRWMINRVDSPWYSSIKIFRQSQDKNWDTVIKDISSELYKLIN